MEILGVGPGEVILILIVLLVVVGPDRLPGFARQAGRMVVSLRNWMQRSPDAMMVMRARDEIQAELQSLRSSFAEEVQNVRDQVQSVRDEVLDVTRELEDTTKTLTSPQLLDMPQPVNMIANGQTVARSTISSSSAAVVDAPQDIGSIANLPEAAQAAPLEVAVPAPQLELKVPAPLRESVLPGLAEASQAAPSAISAAPADAAAIEALQAHVDRLSEELRMLREQLSQRGVLGVAPQLPTSEPSSEPPTPENTLQEIG